MAAYPPYTPHTSAGFHYRTHHYQAGHGHGHRNEHQSQRSPFPRDGTPPPTIRGKPGISPHQHQRAGFMDAAYHHMAQAYAWANDQDYVQRNKSSRKTEQWVLEQQLFLSGADTIKHKHKDAFPSAWEEKTRYRIWEELVYSYEMEADRWMRQEEETRRLAAERERAKAHYVQEELKRVEARIRHKREVDRQKMVEERLQAQMEARERDRRERTNVQKAIIEAWNAYETGWESLINSTSPLGFCDIPWPTKSVPKQASDITPSSIVALLLSPFHSMKQTRKDRIRSAQLRWHPDRFGRLMSRVREEDKEAVEEGVGIIARCLNDLMSKEKATTR